MITLLKMKKNAFYFVLKALLTLKIFTFLSWLFGHVEKNGLIRKVSFEIYHVTAWLNISGIKGNQTMKFGQLIEYNKRNNFP